MWRANTRADFLRRQQAIKLAQVHADEAAQTEARVGQHGPDVAHGVEHDEAQIAAEAEHGRDRRERLDAEPRISRRKVLRHPSTLPRIRLVMRSERYSCTGKELISLCFEGPLEFLRMGEL